MKQEPQILTSDRIICFDCLRIFATLAVMILHVSSYNWYSVDVISLEWQIFNFFDSIVRWCVPIFVMISGALFLDKECDIKKLYTKNILRIITAFIFWSILYALVNLAQGDTLSSAIVQIVKGHYHMWFLFMIVGLYIIVPFAKKITESDVLIKYFLVLSLIFTFIIPECISVLSFVDEAIGNAARDIAEKINFHFTLGYLSYFILGYYLSKVDLSGKIRRLIYILSFLGFVSTITMSSFASLYRNEATGIFYEYFTINVMLESIGVFVFFKYTIPKIIINKNLKNIILKLSKYSLGAYLVHAMVIEQLNNIGGLNTLSFNSVLAIPVITSIVFIVSFSISLILNHTPILKKYIV